MAKLLVKSEFSNLYHNLTYSLMSSISGHDIMGPLPETEKGNKYVLVAADCFTKWVEVYGIPNQEAVTVAVKLVDEMFCRYSPPEQVHSDQGRQLNQNF